MARATADDLLRDPIGRFAIGDHFLIWCASPSLCGIAVWGRLSLAELEQLVAIYDGGERSGIAVPCDFVFDVRRLDGLEVGAFERLVQDVAARIGDLRRRLRRQAFVRTSTVWGAALSGFYPTLGVEFDQRLFTELGEALAWLDEPDGWLADHVDQLIAEAVAGSPLVDRLRGLLLERIPERVAIHDAARALAISTRSLQRHLRDAGTSFRAELDQARLAVAQRLLCGTDLKIAAIAQRVGASSEANFISFFRRITTRSPAAWRRGRPDSSCLAGPR